MTTSPVSRAKAWIDGADGVDLVLRFSLIAVVVASHYEPVLMVATACTAVALLADRRLLHHPAPWIVGGIVLAAWQVFRWYTLDNHVWLTTYWVLAVGLSLLGRDRQKALSTNGRLMVGLVFALAAAWKLGSVDFRTGDFFHYSLLGDERFGFVAEHVGGIDSGTRDSDRQATYQLVGRPTEWVALDSSDAVRRLALVFTLWGAFIELAIAVTWLFPVGRWTRLRHITLLAFAATTYAVVPVGGFGCLLMAMGLTQVRGPGRARTAYGAAFVLLVCYGPVWQTLFGP